jgi:hypothetical protein
MYLKQILMKLDSYALLITEEFIVIIVRITDLYRRQIFELISSMSQ